MAKCRDCIVGTIDYSIYYKKGNKENRNSGSLISSNWLLDKVEFSLPSSWKKCLSTIELFGYCPRCGTMICFEKSMFRKLMKYCKE